MPPTFYTPSTRRLSMHFLGSLAFVLAGLLMLVLPAHPTLKMELVGPLSIAFFGLVAVMTGRRLLRRGPELTVTDEGFEHRLWGRVGWGEVQLVGFRTMRVRTTTQNFIEVRFIDTDAFVAKLSPRMKALAAGNRRLGYSPVTISTNTFPAPLAEVLAEMQLRHQRFLGFDVTPPVPNV